MIEAMDPGEPGAEAQAYGACAMCRELFAFNPETVPETMDRDDPSRSAHVCRTCAQRLGLPIPEGAYP